MRSIAKISLPFCIAALLSACGGGGGGAGVSATLSPFVSWDSIQPNTTVTANGISQSGSYTYNTQTATVTSLDINASSEGATYRSSFDSNFKTTNVSFTPAGGSTISWNRSVDTFGELAADSRIDVVISADGKNYALAMNPYDVAWDYQSFGIWLTGAGTGSGTFGAISVGAATPGNAIPTSGIGQYFGYSGGRYIDNLGRDYFTSSYMQATADFSTRSVTFNTSETQVSRDLLNFSVNNNLNLTGTLSYNPGVNQITGNISTLSNLNGTANARFYGPAATEIGGTFSVTSGGIEGYAGAFGGQ